MSPGILWEGLSPPEAEAGVSGHLAALLALPRGGGSGGGQLTRCFLFNFDVQVLTRAIYKFDIVNGGLNGFSD